MKLHAPAQLLRGHEGEAASSAVSSVASTQESPPAAAIRRRLGNGCHLRVRAGEKSHSFNEKSYFSLVKEKSLFRAQPQQFAVATLFCDTMYIQAHRYNKGHDEDQWPLSTEGQKHTIVLFSARRFVFSRWVG